MTIKNMSSKIKGFFQKTANKTAKETKFVQRKSKMTGCIFLMTFVFGFIENPKSSLNDLAEFCEDHFGIEITSQGLDERIHKYTVIFFQKMFLLALTIFRHSVLIPLKALTQFSEVNITDSTGISLPENLSDDFPGSGGSGSKAALKVQLVFDFLTGCFKSTEVTDGITPDQAYKKHLDQIKPNSLNLFDLGYFSLNNLKAFFDKGAYFLTRFLTSTGLYNEDGTRFKLLEYLRSETRSQFELELRVGAKFKLPCRLFFFRTPEEIANRRRQQAKKNAKEKGRKPNGDSLELMGWTILVSNVPVHMLSIKLVGILYALRWQVELMFKLWKSELKIASVSGFKKERVLCEIYAKLIGMVLFQFLAMPLRKIEIDLSPTKAFKRFVRKIREFAKAINSAKKLEKVIKQTQDKILKYAKREKRKKRLTTCQQILLEVNYYA